MWCQAVKPVSGVSIGPGDPQTWLFSQEWVKMVPCGGFVLGQCDQGMRHPPSDVPRQSQISRVSEMLSFPPVE